MDVSKYSDMVLMYVGQYGLKIIAAILIFIIGKWAVKRATALSRTLMLKAKVDKTFVEFLESVIYFVLLIVVILASLNTLGINTTSFLAIFGAAGLAVGLALKDSLSNIGAAVLIIIFRPFKVGDTIESAGTTGTVKDINLFSTILEPIDQSIVIVPNSSIINGNITNFSQRTQRRVEHVFGIGYDDDLKLAKETLMQIILSDERVLSEPAPLVAVSELGESSVNFVFRAWVKTDDYWDVHFDMLERVKLVFDEKGISIPYPQMDIHSNKTEGKQ
ncbi:mechanosensitive ion channel family protein [Sulfurimonas sp.]|uniref:mechanosensitive ion channel family protein n=1 Tax=Sulfurimonas sp. TaxID=2022749 RepID=UPI0035637AD3